MKLFMDQFSYGGGALVKFALQIRTSKNYIEWQALNMMYHWERFQI